MPPLTEKLHTFRYLDGAVGFHNGRTYPLRYQVLEDGSYSIEPSHVVDDNGQPRPDVGPLVLSAADFKKWFALVA